MSVNYRIKLLIINLILATFASAQTQTGDTLYQLKNKNYVIDGHNYLFCLSWKYFTRKYIDLPDSNIYERSTFPLLELYKISEKNKRKIVWYSQIIKFDNIFLDGREARPPVGDFIYDTQSKLIYIVIFEDYGIFIAKAKLSWQLEPMSKEIYLPEPIPGFNLDSAIQVSEDSLKVMYKYPTTKIHDVTHRLKLDTISIYCEGDSLIIWGQSKKREVKFSYSLTKETWAILEDKKRKKDDEIKQGE